VSRLAPQRGVGEQEVDDVDALDEAPEQPGTGTEAGPEESVPSPSEASPEERRRARRRMRLVAALLAALVLALAACAALALSWYGSAQETADRAAAADAARTVTGQLVTVTSQNASAHIDVMLARSADPFRQQLTGITAVFEEILKQGQVSAEGAVEQVGIESIGDGHATALVTASTLVHNTQTPQGARRDYRLAGGLVQVDGDWRVSSVDVAS
jgi:Mce-associated membrane protein